MWLVIQYHGPNDSKTQHQAELFPKTRVEFDRQLALTYHGPETGSKVLGSETPLLLKVPGMKWPSKYFSNCPDDMHHFYDIYL